MKLLDTFTAKVIAVSDHAADDMFYLRNRVLALVSEEGAQQETKQIELIALKDELVDLAVQNNKVGELVAEKDCLGAELINFIMPVSSQVNRKFWDTYTKSPQQAIAGFYTLGKHNGCIKVAAVVKNITSTTSSRYGDIQITINLSKPKEGPKIIAQAKLVKASSYPKCQLCMENEGYQGRISHPARTNYRTIHMKSGDEKWGFQCSPYAYFSEHCIILNTEHVPMVINKDTFAQLLDIVDIFPGCFAGSNSNLSIIGGSVLTHNHCQGGRHVFSMEIAELDRESHFKSFSDVKTGIVNWPTSVIRSHSADKNRLVKLAETIRLAWRDYSNDSISVIAYTGDTPYHTVTSVAHRRRGLFELDIVLRDNHTTAEFPSGAYHPHVDVQHVKKKNIGLVEVMDLTILPPRLKDELSEVEEYLLNQYNEIADYHKDWAGNIKECTDITARSAHDTIQEETERVFIRVLKDAGVYKRNEEGRTAFMRFIDSVGLEQEKYTSILMLGGAGCISSHMVDRLIEKGDEKVVVVSSLVIGHRTTVHPDATSYQGDLADQDFMRRVFTEDPDIDAVIHFAAYSLVAGSMERPLKYFDNNTADMVKLLEVMNEFGVKYIVFSSTAATYGIPDEIPIKETTPQCPINPYGESKLMMGTVMKWSDQAYSIKFVPLHYFSVAGVKPDGSVGEGHGPETHLLPIILQAAQGIREKIMIFGNGYSTPDGTNVRDYVHPFDLAGTHLLTVKYLREGNPSTAFNLGSSTGFSNLQIPEAARKVTGKEIPAELADRRPGDPDTLIASSDKARKVLGWKSQFDDIEKIIAPA